MAWHIPHRIVTNVFHSTLECCFRIKAVLFWRLQPTISSLPGSGWLDAALPLPGAPELRYLTPQSASNGWRDADARGPALVLSNYFSRLQNFCVFFLSHFPLFLITPLKDWVWESAGGGRRQRTSGLLSDGAAGLRELRAHGGPGVNDAGGWTLLLPGKNA